MFRTGTTARQALTLIELIVVLVILVGLAGIVVPMLPNMLGRTHTAAGATNMQEIVKWVQTYEQLYFANPDEWDALTDGTNLVDYLPSADGGTTLVGGKLTAAPLAAGEVDALASAGVVFVHLMAKSAPASKTFDPYSAPVTAPTAITASTGLAILDPLSANEKMGLSPLGKYVAFGVGKRSKMVGKVMAEAPVVFADETLINASDYYARFLVVYKVAQKDTAADPYVPLPRALMVGSVSMHPDDIDGIGQHLQEYYDTVKASK